LINNFLKKGKRFGKTYGRSLFAGLVLAFAMPLAGDPPPFKGVFTLPAMLFFALPSLYGGVKKENPFLQGFLSGFFFFSFSMGWILYPMRVYGGLPLLLALPPFLLLISYLSIYFGLSLWVTARFPERYHPFLFPMVFTGLEEVRGYFLTGFPWTPLYLAYYPYSFLLKPATLLGGTGVTFFTLLFSTFLYEGVRRKRFLLPGIFFLSLIPLYCIPDFLQERSHSTFRYLIVQGNIPQDLKWTPALKSLTLQIYEDLTRQGVFSLSRPPDLIIWPETAIPFYIEIPSEHRDILFKIPQGVSAPVLFGAPAFSVEGGKNYFYNRAYLLSPQGEISGFYDKVHLVPFGEYVPLRSLLFFVEKLTEGIGDFTGGKERVPIRYGETSLGVLICFEAIFSREVLEFVRNGANLLVHITNDAWFGFSPAPYQHLAFSQVRAIETGLPLLRSANTGVSALISHRGEILRTIPFMEKGWIAGELKWKERVTPYRILGLYLPYFWIGIALFFSGWAVLRWKKISFPFIRNP